MFDANAVALIRDAMVESGIVEEDGSTGMIFKSQDREYLVSLNVFDITGWAE